MTFEYVPFRPGRVTGDERDGDPIPVETVDRSVSAATVFERWLRREAAKPAYPDADATDWRTSSGESSGETLRETLRETYEEPVEPVVDAASWSRLRVSGDALGRFGVFPSSGWPALSDDGTIGGAVDRLQREDTSEAFPDATPQIEAMRASARDEELGALVAWADNHPPTLLEGNHRACAVHWLSRTGEAPTTTVHLAHDGSLSGVVTDDPGTPSF